MVWWFGYAYNYAERVGTPAVRAVQGRRFKAGSKAPAGGQRYERRRRNCRSLSGLGMTIVERRHHIRNGEEKRTIARGLPSITGRVVVTWGTGRNACATERRRQNSKLAPRNSSGTQTARRMPFVPQDEPALREEKSKVKRAGETPAVRNGVGSTSGAQSLGWRCCSRARNGRRQNSKAPAGGQRYVRQRRNCRSLSALGMTIVEQRHHIRNGEEKRTIGRGCQASRGGVVVTWGAG